MNPKNTVIVHGDHNPVTGTIAAARLAARRTLNAPGSDRIRVSTIRSMSPVSSWKSPVNNKLYIEGGVTLTKNKQWF